jgi:hypothetical protein
MPLAKRFLSRKNEPFRNEHVWHSTPAGSPPNTSLERTRERQSAKLKRRRARRSAQPLGVMRLRRTLLLALEAICVLAFFAAGAVALMFVASDTPAEAIARGLGVVPAGCEVGFYTGGRYFCWYSLSGHPILFCLALGAMIALATAMKCLLWLNTSDLTPNKSLERTSER